MPPLRSSARAGPATRSAQPGKPEARAWQAGATGPGDGSGVHGPGGGPDRRRSAPQWCRGHSARRRPRCHRTAVQRDHRRGMARSPRGLRLGRDYRRVALGSRHMDTQGRVPVRPARLALRPGGGEDRADLCPPRSCCRHGGIHGTGMRHRAPPAMPGRPPRSIADAAGIGAARARRDRAVRRSGRRAYPASSRCRPRAGRRAHEDLARPLARPPIIGSADARRKNCQLLREHEAFRYDAFPPWTDPDTWWYRCDGCGDDRITGAKLKASPVIHVVATYGRISNWSLRDRSPSLRRRRIRAGRGAKWTAVISGSGNAD